MNHAFDIEHAAKYGLHEAILIANFQFWIAKNKANRRHEHDGRTWTYNSSKALAELLPYLSAHQIRRTLDSLVEQGVLIKGNFNASAYDRTLWFAFADENLFEICQPQLAKLPKGIGKTAASLTDINTDDKPDVFIDAWAAYPKRSGGNSKINAKKAWDARIKDGVKPEDMLAGIQRYARYCDATGKTGTEFVKQAATFLGPGMHFCEPYTIPIDTKPASTHTNFKDRKYVGTDDAEIDWLHSPSGDGAAQAG